MRRQGNDAHDSCNGRDIEAAGKQLATRIVEAEERLRIVSAEAALTPEATRLGSNSTSVQPDL